MTCLAAARVTLVLQCACAIPTLTMKELGKHCENCHRYKQYLETKMLMCLDAMKCNHTLHKLLFIFYKNVGEIISKLFTTFGLDSVQAKMTKTTFRDIP